jgi:CRP-like cAMP-binding protein
MSKMYSTSRGVYKPIRYLLQCRWRAFARSLVQLSCWEVLWGCVCLADLWLVSSAIAFVPRGGPGFLAIDTASWVFSLLAWADVCVHLKRSLLDETLKMRSVKSVSWEYLLLWFWVDAVASVPVYVLLGLVGARPLLAGAFVLVKLVRAYRACQRCFCRKIWALDAAVQGDCHGYDRLEPGWRMPSVLWLLNLPGAFTSLALMAHANACIWAVSHPGWDSETGLGDGLADYGEAFYRMNLELAIDTTRFPGLQVLLSVERLVISGYILFWIVMWTHVAREERATSLAPRRTLQYLRLHGTSKETYLQVEKFLREVSSFLRVKGDFELTMSKALPADLSWKVREELWSQRLLSLSLLSEVNKWDRDIIGELAQRVTEEVYAPNILVCSEGDPATSAYYVLSGELRVDSSLAEDKPIAPFTRGMWLGERALVNHNLCRSGTVFAGGGTACSLMVVPAEDFHVLLEEADLTQKFQEFCREHIWRGLCGRCGALGDHFADGCPLIGGGASGCNTPVSLAADSPNVSIRVRTPRAAASARAASAVAQIAQAPWELQVFLRERKMEHLLPFLERLGVHDLFGLELLEASDLRGAMEKEHHTLTDEEARLVSRQSIQDFREHANGKSLHLAQAFYAQHHIFLSHYKVEGGTEAALMRQELEQLLQAEHPAVIRGMESPIFLDSEDLESTDDILARVRSSSNLVLLLTNGVLTRPWCLIEIATAVRHGVEVIPVEVSKPGNQFEIPDEAFYAGLTRGDLMSKQARDLVLETGFSLSEVAACVRQVFKRIVLPYSPHRPASSRKPELQKVLKACRTRKAVVSAQSSLRSTNPGMAQSMASRISYDFCPNSSAGTSVGTVDERLCFECEP